MVGNKQTSILKKTGSLEFQALPTISSNMTLPTLDEVISATKTNLATKGTQSFFKRCFGGTWIHILTTDFSSRFFQTLLYTCHENYFGNTKKLEHSSYIKDCFSCRVFFGIRFTCHISSNKNLFTLRLSNIAVENPPLADLIPITKGGLPLLCYRSVIWDPSL